MDRGESDTEVLEKHYRVTLDFRLLVRAITPEVCQESFFFNEKSDSASEPYFQENIERQRRLYQLLRNNRGLLEQYLLSALTQEAGICVCESLPDAFDVKDEDEILVPLYKSMDKEDVRFFDECREMGALDANTELIGTAFKVEWVGAEVEEMNRRMAGDVKRAKIVERTKTRLIRSFNSLNQQLHSNLITASKGNTTDQESDTSCVD
jgi:hypothetical protein